MLKLTCLSAAALCAATLVVVAGAAMAAPAAPAVDPHFDTFATSDGTPYFALSLSPNAVLPEAPTREVIMLVDTSASQTSVYRDKSLSALGALLTSLPRGDRVRLMAVDLEAVELTDGFVAPQGEAIDRAVAALKQRVPLGATDMPAVLQAAAASFSTKGNLPRVLLYIGDGMSAAHFLDLGTFGRLIDQMTDSHVPLSSYAVGPRIDSALLASLANQTGGVLAIDGEDIDSKQVGTFLASAARASVFWPREVTWPKAFAETYPKRMPPLRSDRDTIVVGKATSKLEGEVHIRMTVDAGGKSQPLNWTLPVEASNDAFAFLPALVESAHEDGGARLVTVGTPGLEETRRMLDENQQLLVKLAEQAVTSGNLETAQRLADEALRRDPSDKQAADVLKRLEKVRSGEPVADAGGAKVEVKHFKSEQAAPPKRATAAKVRKPAAASAAPARRTVEEDEPVPGAMLDSIEQQNRLITGAIRAEVENQLREARATMSNDPGHVEQDLKLLLERVAQTPELKTEVRAQLRTQLETALREANRRLATKEILDQQSEEARAAAADRLQVAQGLVRNKRN